MSTKTKTTKKDATRAMRDVSDLPPARFALPNEGRQAKHLQRQRKEVAVQIAKYANADGTKSFPSVVKIATAMGCSRRTVFRLLDDLRTLGFLHDGDIHETRKTRIRTLDLGKMKPAPVTTSAESPVTSSESPVPSSPNTCDIFDRAPVSSTQAPVSSCTSPVPKEDGTQPSTDRPRTAQNNIPTSDRPQTEAASGKPVQKPERRMTSAEYARAAVRQALATQDARNGL